MANVQNTRRKRVGAGGVVHTSRQVRGSIIFSGECEGVIDNIGRVRIKEENVELRSGKVKYRIVEGQYSLRLILSEEKGGFRGMSYSEGLERVQGKVDRLLKQNNGRSEEEIKRCVGSKSMFSTLEHFDGHCHFSLGRDYSGREFNFLGRDNFFELYIEYPTELNKNGN